MKTRWENITVDNSPMGLYIAEPNTDSPAPVIVVIQNQDGVREFTQAMTRRVAEAGYFGVAPQLFHREGEPQTPEETANLKNYRRDVNVHADIDATVNFLRGCTKANPTKLGVVGFCMGGRIAFLMAATNPKFKVAVDFYGGGVYSRWGDRPPPAEFAANISCPLQGHFGEVDKNPPPDEMRTLDAELNRLGKTHEFYFYPDAPHGFNRNGWKGYKPDHDATSWQRTLNFFEKHLGVPAIRQAAANQ